MLNSEKNLYDYKKCTNVFYMFNDLFAPKKNCIFQVENQLENQIFSNVFNNAVFINLMFHTYF